MMKRKALLTVAVFAPVAALALAAGRADDTAMVKKTANEFQTAWNKHDAQTVASFWAKDGDLICPDGKVESNDTAIEKYFTKEYGPGGQYAKSSIDIKKDTVRFVTSDVALADWNVLMTGATKADGMEEGPMTNRVVIVFKKEGGNWKFFAARPGIPETEAQMEQMKHNK